MNQTIDFISINASSIHNIVPLELLMCYYGNYYLHILKCRTFLVIMSCTFSQAIYCSLVLITVQNVNNSSLEEIALHVQQWSKKRINPKSYELNIHDRVGS